MKSKFLVVCLGVILLLAAVGAPAQGKIYVPDNTPTTGSGNAWPFNINTYWSYLYVIKAASLPAAPFKVTDIAFAPTGNKAWSTTGRFQIRMANTTVSVVNSSTCFKDVMGACPTIVNDVPAKNWTATANTWSPIGLTCAHGYDGRSNLAVHIRYDNGSGGVTLHYGAPVSRAYIRSSTASVFNTLCANQGDSAGPKTCLTIDRTCVALASPTVKVGQTAGIQIVQAPPGFYQIAASLGQGPPISLGTCTLCLQFDGLFLASILSGPPTFNGYSGTVTPNGTASAKLLIPAFPGLVGLCIHHAGVIFDGTGIKCCTNTTGTEIIP